MKQNYHVTKRQDGKWQALGENNKRASAIRSTQAEAFNVARELATKKRSEVSIHGVDGKIRDKRSYGNDPYPPKG